MPQELWCQDEVFTTEMALISDSEALDGVVYLVDTSPCSGCSVPCSLFTKSRFATTDYITKYDTSFKWSKLVAIHRLYSCWELCCRFVELKNRAMFVISLTLFCVSQLQPWLWWYTIGVRMLMILEGIIDDLIIFSSPVIWTRGRLMLHVFTGIVISLRMTL